MPQQVRADAGFIFDERSKTNELSLFPDEKNKRERWTMKVQPLHDRILVRRVESEEKTAGGLYIPETAKEKPLSGLVVACGKGKILEDGSRRTLDVKEGDKILFGKYAGTEINLDGEEHLILREDDILAVVND